MVKLQQDQIHAQGHFKCRRGTEHTNTIVSGTCHINNAHILTMKIYKQKDIIGAAYKHRTHSKHNCRFHRNVDAKTITLSTYMHKLYKVSFPYMTITIQAIIHQTHRIMLLPAVDDHVALSSCTKDIS